MFEVLIIEDEIPYARALLKSLQKTGISVTIAENAKKGIEKAQTGSFDVILLDNRLPDIHGLKIVGRLCALQPGASILMMTAFAAIEDAVEAMRQGAEDYIIKSTHLSDIVDKVLEIRQRNEKRKLFRDTTRWSAETLLGECPKIKIVKKQIEEVAISHDTTVLLTGESGTGKEVAARSLHILSGKPKETFVPVDCLSLPQGLAESHLFGHEKGSFTGADKTHIGFFESAGNGTVFLDEIGDIDMQMQGKLLRTLETRTFNRLGSTNQIMLHARVILATNRNLPEMVEKGLFREDLYHRISVFPIHLPPLRERGDDILLLAHHFLNFFSAKLGKKVTEIDDIASQLLLKYDYPGNVRELKNIIERAVILAKGDKIVEELLPDRVLSTLNRSPFTDLTKKLGIEFVPGIDTIESVEKKMILKALEASGGVKSVAAEMLGISRFQLLRRLEKYGDINSEIEPNSKK